MAINLTPPTINPGAIRGAAAALAGAAGQLDGAATQVSGAAGNVSSQQWSGAGADGFRMASSAAGSAVQASAGGLRDAAGLINSFADKVQQLLDQFHAMVVTYQALVATAQTEIAFDTLSLNLHNLATDTAMLQGLDGQFGPRLDQLRNEVRMLAAAFAGELGNMRQRQTIAGYAFSQVGYGEQPLGSNIVPRYWNWVHPADGTSYAWCSVFATWTWHQAGVDIGNIPDSGNLATWAQQNTHLTTMPPGNGILPGDALFYGTQGRSDHVGVVVNVDQRGWVQTVEGNVNDQVTFFNWHDPNIEPALGPGTPAYGAGAPVK